METVKGGESEIGREGKRVKGNTKGDGENKREIKKCPERERERRENNVNFLHVFTQKIPLTKFVAVKTIH